jgi:hypothetical protein
MSPTPIRFEGNHARRGPHPLVRLVAPVPSDGWSRPPEQAQLVWQRVLALTQPGAPEGTHAIALDLLAAARYNPDTMAHALSLGRTYLEDHPGDGAAQNGAGILRAAIELLGARPRADDAASEDGSQC